MKFPEEAKLSLEAKDLICRLLCDVEHRLGARGADEIKVRDILQSLSGRGRALPLFSDLRCLYSVIFANNTYVILRWLICRTATCLVQGSTMEQIVRC